MAEEKTTDAAATTDTGNGNGAATATIPVSQTGAELIVQQVTKMADGLDQLNGKHEALEGKLNEALKPQYRYGMPNAFGIRKGEDPLTSRPYSLTRLAKALRMRLDNNIDWDKHAKVEIDLSKRLNENYYHQASWDGFGGGILCPLGSELMPTEDKQVEDEQGRTAVVKGMTRDFVNECRQVMKLNVEPDLDELSALLGASGVTLRKDLSANTATSGGTLVGLASQGELIELLRAMEFMSQVGAQEIDLPPQGKIRFPRSTGSVTIAATTEGATITESTPTTGALNLSAKPYTGLTDIPDELIKFSTSVAVEAWLRTEFTREIGLKADRDMINGPGGTSIQGVILYSGLRVVVASTVGANGNTLDPPDPTRLYADIADQNAPVDRGFFFGCTATLWGGITTRQATTNEFIFAVGTQLAGGGRPTKALNGERLVCSTQIPTNRVKGSGTTLTLLLGGVGSEWLIGRAGVVEIVMTNSDASKFAQRISTMRGTQYLDCGPRHENSFGMIDTILNS